MDVCPCEIVYKSFCPGNHVFLKPGLCVRVREESVYQRERESSHHIIMAIMILQIISPEIFTLISNNIISEDKFWSVIVLQLE